MSVLVLAAALSIFSQTESVQDPAWSASVPAETTRTWLGPELYACRLQDWRLQGGHIQCVEGAARNPIRVVHCLAATLGPERASFEAAVVLETADLAEGDAESCAGLLLGAGGEHVPYPLSALCHSRPAKDGGIAVGVDRRGRVVFRDNETNVAGGGWSVSGKLAEGEFLEIDAAQREDPDGAAKLPDALHLRVTARPEGASYAIEVEVQDALSEATWSRATLHGVGRRNVEGNLSLFSHLASDGGGAGWSFRDWTASGPKLVLHAGREFGPVLATQFTTSRGVLKLTAQMPPLGASDARTAALEVLEEGQWREVASAVLEPDSFTLPFRVEGWDASVARDYRVAYALRTGPDSTEPRYWNGTIPAEPGPDQPLVVAAFTGNKHFTGGIQWNSDGVWFPHDDIVGAVRKHAPDLLFFSGDQIYEGDLTGAQRRPEDKSRLDYLDKWYRWCWAFGDLAKDCPTICIPDDHDVYHGNLWGAGGRAAKRQDDGGYTMPARFVRMVERTQTSHLPDPFDPTPVEQGIGVYYTTLDYGGVSFAILEDRKFKSSATPLLPEGECKNGWFQNPEFDPATESDVEGAVLLGQRQLDFIESWAADWRSGTWMKCALSQTIFSNVATLPEKAASGAVLPGLLTLPPGEYAPNDVRAADTDSNGWPKSGRDRALRGLRKAFAFHIAGDQHLGSMVRYGIEEYDDAGYALCVPSIANTWPRRWFPRTGGEDRAEGDPKYTGLFEDGFGNKVRVLAVSNPRQTGVPPEALHDRAPGYGIVRFDKRAQTITAECWPRWADPESSFARQYEGWPVTVEPFAAPPGALLLARVELVGLQDPLVQVSRKDAEGQREVIYTRRATGTKLELHVREPGLYDLRITAPGGDEVRWVEQLEAGAGEGEPMQIEF